MGLSSYQLMETLMVLVLEPCLVFSLALKRKGKSVTERLYYGATSPYLAMVAVLADVLVPAKAVV
jgi:hypothetical protein